MNSLDLAKYIVTKCHDKTKDITITKVHKLLYITYGSYLYEKNKPLFLNFTDKPYCYPYGPLFIKVQEYNYNTKDFIKNKYIIEVDKDIKRIINEVVNNYGDLKSGKLSSWSHREGSAWDRVVKEKGINYNVINDEYIKEEFIEIFNENK